MAYATKRLGQICILVVALMGLLPWAQAARISGVVVGVTDGDSITVLTSEKRQLKVRLSQIDAPELRQPYGRRSKSELSDLIYRKTVTLVINETDRYGRSVADVYVDGIDVNATMVSRGAAWVYTQYARDPRLKQRQAQAKGNRVGLWSLPDDQIVPPWEWRRNARPGTSQARPEAKPEGASPHADCTKRPTCKAISTCEEALFRLRTCGQSSLDRDGDGVPCEALCRSR